MNIFFTRPAVLGKVFVPAMISPIFICLVNIEQTNFIFDKDDLHKYTNQSLIMMQFFRAKK